MKVFVKGFGEIELTQKNFIAQGGEGSIYGKGKVAYKIFEDPSKMMPVAKIQDLSALTAPNIIKPELLILDDKSRPIGYTMKLLKDTYSLCQLFTKAFKQRNNISHEQIIHVIKELQKIVSHIHSKNILIVDLNELNFLTDKTFNEVYGIDVNSYQTKNFPATVIMESIRDRHAKKFSAETDWFSFAIVAFQLLIGIHPYKGNHPNFEGMPIDQRINERMLKNVSVFNKDTHIPKVCYPFDIIPTALRNWFIALFEKGERLLPPNDYESIVQIIAKIDEITGTNLFDIFKIISIPKDEEIVDLYISNDIKVIISEKHIFYGKEKISKPKFDIKIGFTPKMNKPIAAYIEQDKLKLIDLSTQTALPLDIAATGLFESDGSLYFLLGNSVLGIEFFEIPNKIQVLTKPVGMVLDVPGTTKVYDGVIIQNLLGRFFASIFPKFGQCYQIKLVELDGYRVIDAKYENKVLAVIGIKNGKYDRFVFRLDSTFQNHDCRKEEDVPYVGLNFTVGDHGICVLLNEKDKVEAFSNSHGSSSIKIVEDKSVNGDFKLFHDGSKILFAAKNTLYSLSLK